MFVVDKVEQLRRELDIAEGYRRAARALQIERIHARLVIDEMCLRGMLHVAQEQERHER